MLAKNSVWSYFLAGVAAIGVIVGVEIVERTAKPDPFPVGSLAAAEADYHAASSKAREQAETLHLAAAKLASAGGNAEPIAVSALLEACIDELDSLQDLHEVQAERKEVLVLRTRESLTSASNAIEQLAVASEHRNVEEGKLVEEELRLRLLVREAERDLKSLAAVIAEGRDLRLLAESSVHLRAARQSNDALRDLTREVSTKAAYFQAKAAEVLALWR